MYSTRETELAGGGGLNIRKKEGVGRLVVENPAGTGTEPSEECGEM